MDLDELHWFTLHEAGIVHTELMHGGMAEPPEVSPPAPIPVRAAT